MLGNKPAGFMWKSDQMTVSETNLTDQWIHPSRTIITDDQTTEINRAAVFCFVRHYLCLVILCTSDRCGWP